MSLREAAQQALEALEGADEIDCDMRDAINAIRTALAEPEQKPVAYVTGAYAGHFTVVPTNPALVLTTGMALYTHPAPQRKPLTDEELKFIADQYGSVFGGWETGFARAVIEAYEAKQRGGEA